MSRKPKSVDMQLDEFGNPVVPEGTPEPEVEAEELTTADKDEMMYTFMLSSRLGSESYEYGEWGTASFTMKQACKNADRLDAKATCKQLQRYARELVKMGFLLKEPKGKTYRYNHDRTEFTKKLKEELDFLKQNGGLKA